MAGSMENILYILAFLVPFGIILVGTRTGGGLQIFAAIAGIVALALCPWFLAESTGTDIPYIFGWVNIAVGVTCFFYLIYARTGLDKEKEPTLSEREQLDKAEAQDGLDARNAPKTYGERQAEWERDRGLRNKSERAERQTRKQEKQEKAPYR